MPPTWSESRDSFGAAANWFNDLVATIDDADWDRTALGDWTVRDLVGHTCRAMTTVLDYLDTGAKSVDVETSAGYFQAVLGVVADPEAVAERGRAAGRALGDDPEAFVRDLTARATARLSLCDGDELVGSPAGGMRLRDYLPSRIFELVVHGTDIAEVVGQPSEPPRQAAAVALTLAGELAVAGNKAGQLLRALTGRPVGVPNVLLP